jgi:hypothetical protein
LGVHLQSWQEGWCGRPHLARRSREPKFSRRDYRRSRAKWLGIEPCRRRWLSSSYWGRWSRWWMTSGMPGDNWIVESRS